MLKESSDWDFPHSEWETEICAGLREEDVVVVRRVSAADLAWMRMPANHCHANVRWYVENDPTKSARPVVGWWVQWPNFILHSVVEIEGQLFCITPSPITATEIPFIPDPKINWIEDGKVYSAICNGQKIGPGVRRYPEFTMAQSAMVRERLLKGIDPYKVINFTDEELEKLKRRHISKT
jgi:hypothetical protein